VQTLLNIKPRLAFAGVGWIGRNRMEAAVKSEMAEVGIISDPSTECIAEAKKLAPGATSLNRFENIFSDPDIDGLVIATPSALHKEQAVYAFEKGKAVFCQKPLGRNAREVQEVINAAREANLLLGADFSYRYTAAFQKILPIIRSGELGKIYAVDLKFHNAYGPGKPWFYDVKLSGGGCVLDLGIHLIDLLLYALDFPEVVKVNSQLSSKGVNAKDKNIVEDYASVLMQLDNDIAATLSCSWNLKAGCEAIIEASFYGTEGGVSFHNINGSFYDFVAKRFWGTKMETLAEPPDAWGGRALVNWIHQLSINNNYDKQADDYYKSAEIIDRIYERY
jgi:predicted dehydrogenase